MTGILKTSWISSERFNEYLRAANGDAAVAQQLYVWNARVSAALFEVIHHVEVLLRNAIVDVLEREGSGEGLPGTPWVQEARRIEEVESRLKRDSKSVTASRIYAGLTFGFWQSLFATKYETMWIQSLHFVFKGSRADRGVIAGYLQSIAQLRNRIAHHGSLLGFDTDVELRKLLRFARWIDADAADWIETLEQVSVTKRPFAPIRNVLVVSAATTWPIYHEKGVNIYICPPERSFQPVDFMCFYADQELKAVVPKIVDWFDAVDFNASNAKRLGKSSNAAELMIAKAIHVYMKFGGASGIYQVFLLSGPKDPETINLNGPIEHSKRGAGSAFTQRHRYFSLAELRSAKETGELA